MLAIKGFSQDGTDIFYLKTKKINPSYAGKTVQLDLTKKSAVNFVLAVNQQPLQFVQHKVESDGFNYWFYQQYFQSAARVGKYNLRLVSGLLNNVSTDSITVTCYFDCYDAANSLVAGKTLQQQYTLAKNILAGLFVKIEKPGM
jgi:hypothetical protein